MHSCSAADTLVCLLFFTRSVHAHVLTILHTLNSGTGIAITMQLYDARGITNIVFPLPQGLVLVQSDRIRKHKAVTLATKLT